jgi:hypothetical protein
MQRSEVRGGVRVVVTHDTHGNPLDPDLRSHSRAIAGWRGYGTKGVICEPEVTADSTIAVRFEGESEVRACYLCRLSLDPDIIFGLGTLCRGAQTL